MKCEVVKSRCYVVAVFLTSVIFSAEAEDRCSLYLLSQMTVELF